MLKELLADVNRAALCKTQKSFLLKFKEQIWNRQIDKFSHVQQNKKKNLPQIKLVDEC